MQIVIPMSGFGERFRNAGYKVPKPLILVEGKPIIEHVVDMFPGETDIIFICNKDHLSDLSFSLQKTLFDICPTGRIVAVDAHKLGPVHAIQKAEHLLDMTQPVVVNYCDFSCYWDWADFREFVTKTNCKGAIPAYKGFHPHSLGNTNYAYMKESDGRVSDIQEKLPYTNNRMEEFASSGTYYFATADLMSKAFKYVVERELSVNSEFYVSLAYKYLLETSQSTLVYPLQHFMQWGTPADVKEYNYWSQAFKGLIKPIALDASPNGSFIVPMAGLGKRFSDQGYLKVKPLIAVSGRCMVLQASNDLPATKNQVFVLRSDMSGFEEVSSELQNYHPGCIIKVVDGVTDGQAITARIGLEALTEHGQGFGPVTFGACDNGALYDIEGFNALLNDPQTDILVWCVRGYANAVRKPEMFGWVDAGPNGLINQISVKTPLDDPSMDPIVIGTFTFKKGRDFSLALDRLIERNGLVNGEFYIDSLINDAIELGLRCKVFEVDSYLCWGTPDDLRTFEYWQSCFHKWPSHPYRIELDARVPEDAVHELSEIYKPWKIVENNSGD